MAILRVPVNLIYSGAGGPGVNVWHVEVPDPVGSASLQVATDILEDFYTGLAGVFPSGVDATTEGVATDVESGDQVSFTPWTVDATGGTGYAPLATAICVTWRTATAQRSGIGRTFVSPIRSGAIDTDGTPTAATLTAVRLAAANLLDANSTAFPEFDGGLGVYSRQNGTFRQFQTARVRDTFAVLRSRRD